MIKRAFEINDIAYLAKNRRIKVEVNGNENNMKNISLKEGDAVKIIGYYEVEKYGYSYEAEYKKGKTTYIIRKHLSQNDLKEKNEDLI